MIDPYLIIIALGLVCLALGIYAVISSDLDNLLLGGLPVAFGFAAIIYGFLVLYDNNIEIVEMTAIETEAREKYSDKDVRVLEALEKNDEYNIYDLLVGKEIISTYYYSDEDIRFINK